MTEEVVVVTDEKPAPTPTQEKALEQGWKPKDQFEGNEEEFIDAAEFVRRGELFGKIEHQSRELKSVKDALNALRQHNSKIEQSAYDRALKSLKDQRRQAIVDGETDKAFQIEDQIDEAQKDRDRVAREAAVPAVQTIPPEFTAWMDKNPWYTKDKIMRVAADKIGLDYGAEGRSPAEVLKLVEREIKEAFPHKFTNPARERESAVEPSSRGGSSVSRSDPSMSEDERNIMRKIVGDGTYITEAEYKKQLKQIKERK